MQYPRLLCSLIFICSIGASVLYAGALEVRETSGILSYIPLSTTQKITFSNGDMVVVSSVNQTQNFSISPILKISFVDSIPVQNPTPLSPQIQQSKSLLDVIFPAMNLGNHSVEILSVDGKILLTQSAAQSNRISLNLNHLSQGIYLCRITDGHLIQTLHFVIK